MINSNNLLYPTGLFVFCFFYTSLLFLSGRTHDQCLWSVHFPTREYSNIFQRYTIYAYLVPILVIISKYLYASMMSSIRFFMLCAFADIWENCFLFGLFSSLLVHGIAALIAFGKLRRHHWGRFFPLLIVLFGIITPLTFGTVTSM